jgi:hypothetical protein
MDFVQLMREEKRNMRERLAAERKGHESTRQRGSPPKVPARRKAAESKKHQNDKRQNLVAPVVPSSMWEVENLCVREWDVRTYDFNSVRAPLRVLEDPMVCK